MAVAAVKLVGGDDCARQEYGERAREGKRPRGEWEEREGDVGVDVLLVDASRASAEAGGGRHVDWREEEDDWQEPVDWAEPGGLVGCAR